MKRCILLTVLLFSLAASPARADAYKIAFDSTWPPFEFLDANKELAGYTVELVTELTRESEMNVTMISSTWDGIFARLNQGEFDMLASSITITEERKKIVDFSLPYFETFQHLLLPASSEAKSFEDLKGKVLGAQTGTVGQALVNSHPGFMLRPSDDLIDAIEDLAAGKLEGVVCDYPVARYYANTATFKNKIKTAPFTITDVKELYGFAVRKGDKALLEKINKGLTLVKENGIERKIYVRWFGEDPIHP